MEKEHQEELEKVPRAVSGERGAQNGRAAPPLGSRLGPDTHHRLRRGCHSPIVL